MAEAGSKILRPIARVRQWQSCAAYLVTSLIVVLPCFWQPRIQAGDLGSHTYNVWLAQLLRTHPVAGLEIHRLWSNVLFDQVLEGLAAVLGILAAEKITVALCVLVFFWGAFRLCSIASEIPPWSLLPALLMITYGLTFNMGFMNFFLSIGLSFWALAQFAHTDKKHNYLGLLLLPLICYAHYLGLVWACAAIVYLIIMRIGGTHVRIALTAAALGLVVASRYYLAAHYSVIWPLTPWFGRAGADQLILGERYEWIAYAFQALMVVAILVAMFRAKRSVLSRNAFMVAGLYLAVTLGAFILPNGVLLPQYAAPVFFLTTRLTLISAVLLLALASQMKMRGWSAVPFAVLAVIFFAHAWTDAKVANSLEAQTSRLVRTMPPGSRFIVGDIHLRTGAIFEHFVDRACIGHCFLFSNYEPASGQFRIQATAANPVVEWNAEAADAMGSGEYVVRVEDLPVYRLAPCPDGTPRFCATELKPGERSGR